MSKPANSAKELVYLYAFERIGFSRPTSHTFNSNSAAIHPVELEGAEELDKADGVIIPQGAFEVWREHGNYVQGNYKLPTYDRDHLLHRKRQLLNAIRANKWVVFLVGCIVDEVHHGYDTTRVHDTDLCKTILNYYSVTRRITNGLVDIKCLQTEFSDYVRDYGVARTAFQIRRHDSLSYVDLMRVGDLVVGFCLESGIFVLPFHTTDRSSDALMKLARIASDSVIEFRERNQLSIPPWLTGVQFKKEIELTRILDKQKTEIERRQEHLEQYIRFKAVLTASGDPLKSIVVSIIHEFFGLQVKIIEEYREDFKIMSQNGKSITAFIEVKGTNGGIRREYINQVDSHRERSGVGNSVPGILVINNQILVHGIPERRKTVVDSEQIKHARAMNVLIIRSIDLLDHMLLLEGKSIAQRRAFFQGFIRKGGGWFCGATSKVHVE